LRFTVSDGQRSDFEYIEIEVIEEVIDPYLSWLQLHFSPEDMLLSEVSGESADPDSDGMTNREEYTADTLPQDAASVLRIVRIVPMDGGLEIHFQSGQEANLVLEKHSQIGGAESDWETISTIEAPSSLDHIFWDEQGNDQAGFYLIKAMRP